jgi:predicted HD phosphohydrolase
MGVVHQFLREVANSPAYQAAHGDVPTESLEKFLSATMDEVRLYWADEYAVEVLKKRDLDDAAHFRHGVMRRELQGDVGYDRQRDHSAHTLNNYLLGWAFFQHSQVFREAFDKQLKARRPSADVPDERSARAFAIVWTWASLLHDTGYLFEGSLSAISPDTQDARIRRGVEVVRDFFEHRFWSEIGLSSQADRKLALGDIVAPRFGDASLGAVADSLRSLPSLEALRVQIRAELGIRGEMPELLSQPSGLPSDAFALWRAHYAGYRQPNMAARIDKLSAIFERLVWRGYPGINVRMLDHAVCSGLLSLQYTTLYYVVHARLTSVVDPGPDLKRVVDAFRTRRTYNPEYWWTLNVWGTAAAAIHNLVQSPPDWNDDSLVIPPLKLNEDPAAYLGVLVDILQDWDRYAVRRGAALGTSAQLPLQGHEVQVTEDKGRLVFTIPNSRLVKKLKEDLSKSLDDWEQLVNVTP